MKLYYKIVLNTSGLLHSFVIRDFQLCTYYKMGEWISSAIPETPLLVFDSLNNAKDFRRAWNSCGIIYACVIKNRLPKAWMPYRENMSELVHRIKQHKPYCNSKYCNFDLPDGSVAVKQVKLLHRVD